MGTYAVVTFGCQMNMHDSERISEVLVGAGYVEAASPQEADVVLLNTCSVREKAEHKLRSEVGRLGLLKRRRPDLVIGVAGCVAQQEGEALIKAMPQIDLVIGPDNIAELPQLLTDTAAGAPPRVRTVFDHESPQFLTAQPKTFKPSAFVTTMKGCDERCTFCVVPFTRGSERYRPSTEIIAEIEKLVDAGTKEVTLLGQTVDSYRDPLGLLPEFKAQGEGVRRWGRRSQLPEDETEFPALLREIAQRVGNLKRLRYTSPHPRHLTPALVAAHKELAVLPRHVHMPVQSGSSRVLKRMGRRYTRQEYIERVTLLRDAVVGLTFSTDIIVGFPGETEADFRDTLSLVEELGFIGVFAFKYSQRPFTAALHFDDDVIEEVKSSRLARLFALSESLRAAHLTSLEGSQQSVLVEGPSEIKPDRAKEAARGLADLSSIPAGARVYTGRTERNEIIHFGAAKDPTGELLTMRVSRALKHSLVGEWEHPLGVRYEVACANPANSSSPSLAVAATGSTAKRLPVLS